MLQKCIHQTHTSELIDQGHMTFRCIHGPLETARVTGPDSFVLPADPGPEPFVATAECIEQACLNREAEAALGIRDPEPVDAGQIQRLHGRDFTEIDVPPLNGLLSCQLTQRAAGQAICLLEVFPEQRSLQIRVINVTG